MEWIIMIAIVAGIAYLADETVAAIENTKSLNHVDDYWMVPMAGVLVLTFLLASC